MLISTQPFAGFPAAGLELLAELADNNNREWFEAHRAAYAELLLAPAQAFVVELGERLRGEAPDLRADPRTDGTGSLLRIYRDTRFSSDPSPYKTTVSGMLWAGPGKKTEHPAFGFQLGADGLKLMAGIFGFSPAMLRAYREAVAEEEAGGELARAAAQLRAAGYDVLGQHYKRVPAPYPSGHPRAALLTHAGLYASPPQLGPAAATAPDLAARCAAHFSRMAPIYRWLRDLEERAGA